MLHESSTGGPINWESGAPGGRGPALNMQAFSLGQVNVPGQRSTFCGVLERT